MSHVTAILDAYPKDLGNIDRQKLADCIHACFVCGETCTACADACLSEDMVAELTRCIRVQPGLRRHLHQRRHGALPAHRLRRQHHKSPSASKPAAVASRPALTCWAATRLYTLGWSGGGPHALACAALLPARLIGAATVGALAPSNAEGLDWTADMGEENIAGFGAALAGGVALRTFLGGRSFVRHRHP
jgi:hypothetical protein